MQQESLLGVIVSTPTRQVTGPRFEPRSGSIILFTNQNTFIFLVYIQNNVSIILVVRNFNINIYTKTTFSFRFAT